MIILISSICHQDLHELLDIVLSKLYCLIFRNISVLKARQDLPQIVEGKVDLVCSLSLSGIGSQPSLLKNCQGGNTGHFWLVGGCLTVWGWGIELWWDTVTFITVWLWTECTRTVVHRTVLCVHLSTHTVHTGHTLSTLVEHTLVVTRQIHPAIILIIYQGNSSLYTGQLYLVWLVAVDGQSEDSCIFTCGQSGRDRISCYL